MAAYPAAVASPLDCVHEMMNHRIVECGDAPKSLLGALKTVFSVS